MDRKPEFLQGMFWWNPKDHLGPDDKDHGKPLDEQQATNKSIVSDEMITEMHRKLGHTHLYGAVKFLSEAEAVEALHDAAHVLASPKPRS